MLRQCSGVVPLQKGEFFLNGILRTELSVLDRPLKPYSLFLWVFWIKLSNKLSYRTCYVESNPSVSFLVG